MVKYCLIRTLGNRFLFFSKNILKIPALFLASGYFEVLLKALSSRQPIFGNYAMHAASKNPFLRRAWYFFICFLLYVNPAWCTQGQAPLSTIQTSNARILEIYQTSPQITPEVQNKIFNVMKDVTDFDTIAEQATNGFCEPASPESCAEFKNVFIELLQKNAISKLGHYRADRFDYQGEDINGNSAVVRSIAHYNEDSVQLDYLLEKRGTNWLIVNYIADGVDTIQNYRRQFSRILSKSSLADLIARLKKKNEGYQ